MTNIQLTKTELLYLSWNSGDWHLVIIWYLVLGAWLFLFRLFFISKEVLQLIHELLNIFELPIDRGKANISHPV